MWAWIGLALVLSLFIGALGAFIIFIARQSHKS